MHVMKKKSLLRENQILQIQLKRAKVRYLAGNVVQKRSSLFRDGNYSDIEKVSDYKTKWINSFYDLHQDIAEAYSRGNLSPSLLRYIQEGDRHNNYNPQHEYKYYPFVVHCSAVISNELGPVLYLEDPFGHIISRPLTWTSLETARSWANRLLIAHIGFNYKCKDYPINRIQTLKFSLYD